MLYESYQIKKKKTLKPLGVSQAAPVGQAPWERLLGEGGQDAEPEDRARGGETQLQRWRALWGQREGADGLGYWGVPPAPTLQTHQPARGRV